MGTQLSLDDAYGGSSFSIDDAYGRPGETDGALTTIGKQAVKGFAEGIASTLQAPDILHGASAKEQLKLFDRIDAGDTSLKYEVRNEREGRFVMLSDDANPNFSVPLPEGDDTARYILDPKARTELRRKYGAEVDPREQTLYKAAEGAKKAVGEALPTTPEQDESFLTGQLPRGVGSMASFLAGGLAGRSLRIGATTTTAGMGASSQASMGFQDAIANGADLETAFDAAGVNAMIGTTEAVPIGLLLGRLDKMTGGRVKAALVRAAKTGTEEAIQEASSQILQNAAAQKLYDPDRDLLGGSGDSAAVGGASGALTGFLTSLVLGKRSNASTPQGERDKAKTAPIPLSEDDITSPLPTHLIGEGRAKTADALATNRATEILTKRGLPAIGRRVTITTPEGQSFAGVMLDASDDVPGRPGTAEQLFDEQGAHIGYYDPKSGRSFGMDSDGTPGGFMVQMDDGSIFQTSYDQLTQSGYRISEESAAPGMAQLTGPAKVDQKALPAPVRSGAATSYGDGFTMTGEPQPQAALPSPDSLAGPGMRAGPGFTFQDPGAQAPRTVKRPKPGQQFRPTEPQVKESPDATQDAAANVADQGQQQGLGTGAPDAAGQGALSPGADVVTTDGDGTRPRPVKVQTAADQVVAADVVAEPTEAQKEAGNYQKGHAKVQGMDISIETPKGGERSGTAPDGSKWSVAMPAHYGYIKRTEGADGEQVDVYLGENPSSSRVFVVDQVKPETGKFDEHKALVGFTTQQEAIAAYDAGFSDGSGPTRRGAVTQMNTVQFKKWLKQGNTRAPVAYRSQQVAAPTAKEPRAVDFETFAAERNASGQGFGDAGLHRSSKNVSKVARARQLDRQDAKDRDLEERRVALRQEYAALVNRGELRPLTSAERLEQAAAGHDDNESTRAARRVLEKRKAKETEQSQPQFTREEEAPALEARQADVQADDTDEAVRVTVTKDEPWDFNDTYPEVDRTKLAALEKEGRSPFSATEPDPVEISGMLQETIGSMVGEFGTLKQAAAELAKTEQPGYRIGGKIASTTKIEERRKALRADMAEAREAIRETSGALRDIWGESAVTAMVRNAHETAGLNPQQAAELFIVPDEATASTAAPAASEPAPQAALKEKVKAKRAKARSKAVIAAGYGTREQQKAVLTRARRQLAKEYGARVSVVKEGGEWRLVMGRATPEEAADLQKEVNRQTDILTSRSQRGRERGAPKSNKPVSLIEWVARQGGIADPGGDLKAADLDRWHVGKPGMPKLIADRAQGAGMFGGNASGWRTAPDLVEKAAVEAGYLNEGESIVEALIDDARTPRFAREDVADVDRQPDGPDEAEVRAEIKAVAQSMNEVLPETDIAKIMSIMLDDGVDAESAVGSHVETLAIQAANDLAEETEDSAYDDIPFDPIPQAQPAEDGRAAETRGEGREGDAGDAGNGGSSGAPPAQVGQGEAVGPTGPLTALGFKFLPSDYTYTMTKRLGDGTRRLFNVRVFGGKESPRYRVTMTTSSAITTAPSRELGVVDSEAGAARLVTSELPNDTERTDQGDQFVIPGTEVTAKERVDARGRQKLSGGTAPMDFGLFDAEARNQTDIADAAEKPKARVRDNAPLQPNPDAIDRLSQMAADLEARLNELGIGSKIGSVIVERIEQFVDGKMTPADGRYFQRIVEVAIDANDPAWVTNHEAIHALRDLGLFRDAEWRALERAVRGDVKRMAEIRKLYPGLNEDAQIEEAIADMFADWKAGRLDATGFLRTAMQRIKTFVEALGNWLRGAGFISAADIFGDVDRGAVGARAARSALAREQAMAAHSRMPINTAAFRRWLGNSKVRGVVYHATSADFDVFDTTRGDLGAHFGSQQQANIAVERNASGRGGAGPNIMPVYLSLQNPLRLKDTGSFHSWAIAEQLARKGIISKAEKTRIEAEGWREQLKNNAIVREAIKAAGYDGVVYKNGHEGDGDSYIAFDPLQVKSATGNVGTFDPSDPRIHLSVRRDATSPFASANAATAGPAIRAATMPMFNNLRNGAAIQAVRDGIDAWRAAFQDQFIDLRNAQREIAESLGRPLAEAENPYLRQELMDSRIGPRLERLADEMVAPLLEGIKTRLGPDGLAKLEEYLYARHAKERNARVSKINPKFKAGEGSGMTDADADKILAKVERSSQAGDIKALATEVDRILDFALKTRIDAGLLSEDEAAAWRSTYEHYVPLRGQGELDPELENERPNFGGTGVTVKGKESKMAMGRESRATDILAHVVMQAQEAIVRAERNEVGKALHELATQAPNPDFWQVDKVEVRPVFNSATGQVEYRPTQALSALEEQHTVSLKIAGRPHRVTFNVQDKRARRLADGMRNLSGQDFAAVVRTLGAVNRWLSVANTTLNPEFVITNAFRDLQTAAINLAQYDAPGIISGTLRDYRKAMVASMRGAFKASKDDEWGRWHREFTEEGGRVYFNRIDDVAGLRKKLMADLQAGDGFNFKVKRGAKAVWQTIENINLGVESAIRLSAYKNAREAGMSKAEAASLAKNLTVNFNRRGRFGPLVNTLYLFYNASVQGSFTMLAAMKSRRVQKILAGVVATGFIVDLINSMVSGDDDDGESHYDKISDFDKERNIIIMLPNSEGEHIKIPLPYGYNVFYRLGASVSELSRGKQFTDVASSLAVTALDSFNPIGGSDSLLRVVSPTITDPVVDLTLNRDFADRPIMPDQPQFGAQRPDAQRYWETVNPAAKFLTDTMTELSGGDEVRAGLIDVSPETIEYMFGQVFGAAGAFYERSAGLIAKLADPEGEVEMNDVPFVRKVVGDAPAWYDKSAFYQRADEIETIVQQVKEYAERGEGEKAARWAEDNAALIGLSDFANSARQRLGDIRNGIAAARVARDAKELTAAEYGALVQELETERDTIISQFNRAYLEAASN